MTNLAENEFSKSEKVADNVEDILLKNSSLNGAKTCKSCRSRQERFQSASILPRTSLSKFRGGSIHVLE